MRLSFRLLIAVAILTAATIAARADAIAGMAGGISVATVRADPQAVSWTQTGSYTNVAISAFIGGTGTVYLTDQIGPGTTVANQIAVTTLSHSTASTSLFSGLDLGPGTYYLIAASNLGGQGLQFDIFGHNAAIPGISGTNNFDELGDGEAAYPPASLFFTAGANRFDFEVTGDPAATPEPSTLVLLGTGLLGIAGMARRKSLSL